MKSLQDSGVVREEVTVPSQGHGSQDSIPPPDPGLGLRAGTGRRQRVGDAGPRSPQSPQELCQGLRGALSQASPVHRNVLEAVKRLRLPIAREATILNRRGRKWKALESAGCRPEDFSSRSLAPDKSPTYCLTKTSTLSCCRSFNPALRFWLNGQKGRLLR